MTNPFDDEYAVFVVLFNAHSQHVIWPILAEVPNGWTAVYGPAGRNECLEQVRARWTDIRPVRAGQDLVRSPA